MPKKTKKTAAAVDDPIGDPVTDLSALPYVLLVEDVSRIYRRGVSTIRRDLRAGTFRGAQPFDRGKPLRWMRADVAADLEKRARRKAS